MLWLVALGPKIEGQVPDRHPSAVVPGDITWSASGDFSNVSQMCPLQGSPVIINGIELVGKTKHDKT